MSGIGGNDGTAAQHPPIGGIGRHGLLFVCLLLVAALPLAGLHAAPPMPAPLTAQDKADLARVVAYLNGIHTMTARFTQVAANSAISHGWLWMERPGRMRFQYDPPSPIVLIADRFYVYYIDRQLAEVQQIGLKSTPAWFLLREPIRFGNDLIVTRFDRLSNRLVFTVVEKAHPDIGALTLVFTDKPMALRQWTVLDQEGKLTNVFLSQEQFGMALDPKLFQYHEPYGDSP